MSNNQIVIDIKHPAIAAGISATIAAEGAVSATAVSHVARQLTRELNDWAGGSPEEEEEEPRRPGPRAVRINRWGTPVPAHIYHRVQPLLVVEGESGGRRSGRTTRMLHKVLATDPKNPYGQRVTVVAPTHEYASRLADRLMELDTSKVLFRAGKTTVYRGDQLIEFVSKDMMVSQPSGIVFEDHTVREGL